MECPVCNGDQFLKRQVDVSEVYGKPTNATVTRICPNCLGSGEGELPLSGKDLAAGGGIGDGERQNLSGGVPIGSGERDGGTVQHPR